MSWRSSHTQPPSFLTPDANFLLRFQLFLAIQTFSSSTHSTGRPCDLKALFASDILVKSCGFLMSDLCLSCWTGQAAGSLFILPIFVSPHQQRTRCKFVTFLNIESFISSSQVHFSPIIAIFWSWFQSGDTGDGFWFCNFWRFPFASSLILLHMQNALIFHLSKKKWLKPGEQITMWWWPFRPSLKIDFLFSQNIWLNIWILNTWLDNWTFEHFTEHLNIHSSFLRGAILNVTLIIFSRKHARKSFNQLRNVLWYFPKFRKYKTNTKAKLSLYVLQFWHQINVH